MQHNETPVVDNDEGEDGEGGEVVTEEELKNDYILLDDGEEERMDTETGPNDGKEEENQLENNDDNDEEEEEEEEAEIADNASFVLRAHSDSVYSVAVHPTISELLLTGGGDDRAFLWDLRAKFTDPTFELAGHKDSVTGTGFNFDGKLCASSSLDCTVKVWNVDSGKLVATCEGPQGGLNWLQWHQKGNVVLSGAEDGSAWMWLGNGTFMQVFSGHSASVSCGCFTANGKQVLTGSDDSTLKVWDPKTGKAHFTFSGYGFHDGGLTCLGTTPHNESVALTGSADATCRYVSVEAGKVLTTFVHADSVESVCFSTHSPNLIATASMDKTAKVWDLGTKNDKLTMSHKEGVVKAAWCSKPSPHDLLIVTASVDRTVAVWDLRNLSQPLVASLGGHRDILLDLCLSSDGRIAVTGSDDHTSRVFKLPPC